MQELKDYAEHRTFLEWMMVVFITIVFCLGVILIIIAIYTDLINKTVGTVTGLFCESMLVLPLNKLEKLVNRRKFLFLSGIFLDEFPPDPTLVKKVYETITRP